MMNKLNSNLTWQIYIVTYYIVMQKNTTEYNITEQSKIAHNKTE